MTREQPICVPLDAKDLRQCRVRRCTIRASHFVTWPTQTGASGSYRCRVHAREFADKHAIPFKGDRVKCTTCSVANASTSSAPAKRSVAAT